MPGLGVRVVDVRDPTAPRQIATAARYDGTTAEHLAAVHLQTSAFSGSVLAAGIQRCVAGGAGQSGLALWDVTDPANPSELGFLPTTRGSRGVHEFTVRQRGDRWYAYLAVPNSEATGGPGTCRSSTSPILVNPSRSPIGAPDVMRAWPSALAASAPPSVAARPRRSSCTASRSAPTDAPPISPTGTRA